MSVIFLFQCILTKCSAQKKRLIYIVAREQQLNLVLFSTMQLQNNLQDTIQYKSSANEQS